MGKRYYCDFCDRYFADSLPARKKHLISIHHHKLRKLHYDSFKDASELLAEEAKKPPCKRFFQTGQCGFGSNCRFSHIDPTTLISAQRSKEQQPDNPEPCLEDWMKTWQAKRQKTSNETPQKTEKKTLETASYALPPYLPPLYQLPPSLLPPPPTGYAAVDRGLPGDERILVCSKEEHDSEVLVFVNMS